MIRFASCCSGIEAASVAWPFWQAAWFSEIEPFPCSELKHHYPDVPNYGDMTLLPERIRSGEIEAPDGPRYKALGNSWAVPVVRWIGERINDAVA